MSGIIYPEKWELICNKKNICNIDQAINLTPENLLHEITKSITTGIIDTDQPIALAFSGGLDSSVLAAILNNARLRFTCITIANSINHPDVKHANEFIASIFNPSFVHHVYINQKMHYTDNYEALFETAKKFGIKTIICGDTIDELLGGYWEHQKPQTEIERIITFNLHWSKLKSNHLNPMNHFAKKSNIDVLLPYMTLYNFIARLPMHQRTTNDDRKIILKQVAKLLHIPQSIIDRRKSGLCDAL